MIEEHWCVRSLKAMVTESRSPRSEVRSLEQELKVICEMLALYAQGVRSTPRVANINKQG